MISAKLMSAPQRKVKRAGIDWAKSATIISGAALLLSPFGWSYALNLRGNYYPEIELGFLLTLALLTNAGQAILAQLISDRRAIWWSILCTLLAALGIAMHQDVFAAYADFRCCILLGLCFCWASQKDATGSSGEFILKVSVWGLIFSAAAYYIFPPDVDIAKNWFVTPAFISAVYLACRRRAYGYMLLAIALGSFLSIVSFYRANLVVAGLLLCIASAHMLLSPFDGRKTSAKGLTTTFLAVCFLIVFGGTLASSAFGFFGSSESRYIQSVGKIIDIWNYLMFGGALNEGDQTRFMYFQFISNHILAFIPPGGLGQRPLLNAWRSFWMPSDQTMLGSSLDGGHLYLAAHFGVFLGLVLIYYVCKPILLQIFSYGRLEFIVRTGALLALLVHFLSSSPFSQVGDAISFGLALGIFARSKTGGRLKRKSATFPTRRSGYEASRRIKSGVVEVQ